jgi:hypothetical protein
VLVPNATAATTPVWPPIVRRCTREPNSHRNAPLVLAPAMSRMSELYVTAMKVLSPSRVPTRRVGGGFSPSDGSGAAGEGAGVGLRLGAGRANVRSNAASRRLKSAVKLS